MTRTQPQFDSDRDRKKRVRYHVLTAARDMFLLIALIIASFFIVIKLDDQETEEAEAMEVERHINHLRK